MAAPPPVRQSDLAQLTEPLCCDASAQSQFFNRMFSHAGVETRGTVLVRENDPGLLAIREFYRPREHANDRGPTTAQRMALYERHAPELAETAARAALADAGCAVGTITHVIPVTCTGFFSPGLDVELIRRLDLSPMVARVQVGFMGCHGAFNALAAARAIVQAAPQAVVLVCCVELCSLHLAYGSDPQRIVANALFADGAAAAVIGAAGAAEAFSGKPRIHASATMLIPQSADAMTWRIGDHGFEMTLSPKIPELVRHHLPQWLEPWLAGHGTSTGLIDHLAIHPGGPKVVSAVAQALGAAESMTAASREVLRQHGNVSSATILLILQRLIAADARGSCLALGFGPGLTAEAMLIEV